jgi:hypothetical protein
VGNEHRENSSIWCRPKKTRKRRRAFLISLKAKDALELDRWAETPITFTNSRWLNLEDADHPTIHGLRGTGILARAEQGDEVDQIANDIGMSRQNVDHYMRFRDQMKVATDGQKRLRLIGKEDWTANADAAISALQIAGFAKLLGKLQNFRKNTVKSVTSVGNGVTVAQQTLTLFV